MSDFQVGPVDIDFKAIERVSFNIGVIGGAVETLTASDGAVFDRYTAKYGLATSRVSFDETGELSVVEVGLGRNFNIGSTGGLFYGNSSPFLDSMQMLRE